VSRDVVVTADEHSVQAREFASEALEYDVLGIAGEGEDA
jgi:hypothetical protein